MLEEAINKVAKLGIDKVDDAAVNALDDAIASALKFADKNVDGEERDAIKAAMNAVNASELVSIGRAKTKEFLTKIAEAEDQDDEKQTIANLTILAFEQRREKMRHRTADAALQAQREATWMGKMTGWAKGIGAVGRKALPIIIAAL